MRVLITGGMGYLGGRLAQHLSLAGNIEVILGSRSRQPPPYWLPSATMIQTDWDSPAQLELVCKGVDAIVHMAAMNAPEAEKDPAGALQVNGVNTVRLLEAAIHQNVVRFIYLSTAHIYGIPLKGVISEKTKIFPIHPYATSHRAAEDVVLAAQCERRIEGVVLRLSNSFGLPAHVHASCWHLLIPDLCRQAVVNKKMVLRSSGTQRRDFLPMSDTCRSIEHILRLHVMQLGEGLFNVGGEWSPTVWEVACMIQQRCDKIFHETPKMVRIEPLPGELTFPLTYSIDRLRRTGFEMKADHGDEIDSLIRYCMTHFL